MSFSVYLPLTKANENTVWKLFFRSREIKYRIQAIGISFCHVKGFSSVSAKTVSLSIPHQLYIHRVYLSADLKYGGGGGGVVGWCDGPG